MQERLKELDTASTSKPTYVTPRPPKSPQLTKSQSSPFPNPEDPAVIQEHSTHLPNPTARNTRPRTNRLSLPGPAHRVFALRPTARSPKLLPLLRELVVRQQGPAHAKNASKGAASGSCQVSSAGRFTSFIVSVWLPVDLSLRTPLLLNFVTVIVVVYLNRSLYLYTIYAVQYSHD